MNERFNKALSEASEIQAMFVLLVVIVLRIYRIIPTLRPRHMLFPISLLQIVVFIFAACHASQFFQLTAIGNFIVIAIAILPSTFQQPKPSAHWVRP